MATVAEKPQDQALDAALTRANDMLNQYARNEATKQQLREQIAGIDSNQAGLKTSLQQWTDTYKEAFAGKKTLQLAAGTIGYKKEGERIAWDLEKAGEDYDIKLLKLVQAEYPSAVEPKVNGKLLLKALAVLPNLRKKLEKLGGSLRNNDQFTISINKLKGDE